MAAQLEINPLTFSFLKVVRLMVKHYCIERIVADKLRQTLAFGIGAVVATDNTHSVNRY